MYTDKHGFKLPEGELTHAAIGAAFDVLNGLGHGFHEKPYENALVGEFGLRGLAFDQQRRYHVIEACRSVNSSQISLWHRRSLIESLISSGARC